MKTLTGEDIETLKKLLDKGKTIRDISLELKVCEGTIYSHMRKNNLQSGKRKKIIENKKNEKARWGQQIAKKLQTNERECQCCGKVFYVYEMDMWAYKRNGRMYCSWTCFRKVEKG